MFSIIYVLTSSKRDYYYEQMMISIESVKYRMPNQKIVVLTDKNTYLSFIGTRKKIFEYADVIQVNVPEEYSQKQASRYIKTSLRKYIEGNILFIDSDTVICDDFSTFDCNESIAMVLDMHIPFGERKAADKEGFGSINHKLNLCGISLENCTKYYNSGVMWIKDDAIASDFFAKWHENWKETLKNGVVEDQISLNYTNMLSNGVIAELSGEWNCQTTIRIRGLKYMHCAHIIHYYNIIKDNSVYALCDEELIRSYNNDENQKLIDIIHNPKFRFREGIIVPAYMDGVVLMNSRQLRLLRIIYEKVNWLYKANERILEIASKLKKK